MPTIPIASIIVGDRCRKDLGDISSLARSIKSVGLLHPPVVTPDLRLVAGERRLAAVRSLGWIDCPVTVAETLTDVLIALQAERDENTCRKELAPTEAVAIGERIEAIERPKAEERKGARTDLQPTGNFPAGLPDAGRTRDAVAQAVGGMSGRTYEKAKVVVAAAEADPEKFAPVVAEMDRTGKVDRAYNAVKKHRQEVADARKAQAVAATNDRFRVIKSSVADLAHEIRAGSVDAIITDPPYPEEFLPTYSDLSKFAFYALKPGGVLLAMVGQAHLPEVIARLSEHLTYHWCIAYVMPGATAKMWGRKIIVGWKPVLWYVKGTEGWTPPSGLMPSDVAHSADRDKEHHEWGQSESGLAALVEKITSPGDTVCDPFCGGGSTGVAALALKRYFIGADVDEAAVNRTKARLVETI